MTGDGARIGWADLSAWTPWRVAVAVITTRAVLAVVLWGVTGGSEFTSDVRMWVEVASEPWGILRGDPVAHPQHPPLLPPLIAAVLGPLSAVLPTFLAIRLTMGTWEAIAAALTVHAVRDRDPRVRDAVAWLWIASPVGWVSSALWAQDEAIAAACWALVVALTARGWWAAAAVAAGLAVVAGKAFLAVPALAWCAAGGGAAGVQRAVLAAVPVVAVYAAGTLGGAGVGAVASFRPGNAFGVSVWSLMTAWGAVPLAVQRVASAALAASFGLWPLGRALRAGRVDADPVGAAMLAWVLCWFYHVNPEYLVLLMPLAGGWCTSRGRVVEMSALAVVAWTTNVLYGVVDAGPDAAGFKGAVARAVIGVSPVPVAWLHGVALAACAVGLGLWAWKRTEDARSPRNDERQAGCPQSDLVDGR